MESSTDQQNTEPVPTERLAQHDAAADVHDDEEDAGERLARSRERNREHARRTRLRKKAQLQVLQGRVKELQEESRLLKQTVEECSIASILLGLSGSNESEDMTENIVDTLKSKSCDFVSGCPPLGGKRKRFLSDASDISPQPMKLRVKGKMTTVGGAGAGKTQINWKTGAYFDEDGIQKQLTPEELEDLRRERNRMHAKMTRDRKKNFISSVEKTIADFERDNKRMRGLLEKQAMHHLAKKGDMLTPSPLLTAMARSDNGNSITPMPLSLSKPYVANTRPPVKVSPATSPAPSHFLPGAISLDAPFSKQSPGKVSVASPRNHGFKVVA